MAALDYDDIARTFDRRYELYEYAGIQQCLLEFVSGREQSRVLEVGCGTGRWLALLSAAGCAVAGIEPSDQMLALARTRVDGDLRRGIAEALPWPDASFDRVVYLNALHHFSNPLRALQESFRVLRPGGGLLSVGLDPHQRTGCWYIYKYFPAALDADLGRFPSRAQRTSWLLGVGFVDVAVWVVEDIQTALQYNQAIQDRVLDRSFTSQLGVITQEQYAAGLQLIRESARNHESFRLEVDVQFYATRAQRPV